MQRVPALLNELHRAIEGTRRRFVLLGSSARRLKTADTNLLGGPAALQTRYPLAPAELGADFDLEVHEDSRELGERQLRTEDGIDVWPLDRFMAAARPPRALAQWKITGMLR